MMVNRQAAGSCALNGSVYVFFGQGENQEPLGSIEKLFHADKAVSQAYFQMVQIEPIDISPDISILARWFPGVAAINDTQVAIMGGMGVFDDDICCLGDAYIFETQSEEIMQKVLNVPGLFQFQAQGNKAARFAEDTMVALVENEH